MNTKDMFRLFLTFICIISLSACASGGSQQPSTRMISADVKAPDWVNKGCQDVKVICGVGSASTYGDYALGRREADNFARVELRSNVETYVGYLMEAYKKRVTSGDPRAVSIMGQTEESMKTVVGGTINGSKIVDRWEHPTKDTIFSLAKIDLGAFKNTMKEMKDLSREYKEYVQENDDKMRDRLNEELGKR